MLKRLCNLPKEHSFFLFGPRQCGKTYLINHLFADKKTVHSVNLLAPGIAERYLADPAQFYRETIKLTKDMPRLATVFIDEIQKAPQLLDSVQILLQETSLQFILTGSSARKLRRGSANLLGGRALERHIFPLTYIETENAFELEHVLRFGSIPGVVVNNPREIQAEILTAYVSTYLREEIQQEAIVRNIPGFIMFLEIAAQQSGEILNYAAVGRDANLHGRTVQSYYQILEDTLLGVRLMSYRKSVRRRLTAESKFYLFDIGIVNTLERQLRSDPDTVRYGRLFEHFIILETHRMVKYLSLDGQLFLWRTREHLEVDLLIENKGKLIAAVEIKSSTKVTIEYLSGLLAFAEEHPSVPCYVVARVPAPFDLPMPRNLGTIQVLPWTDYLQKLSGWIT